jgi:predicted dehydrogenase
MKASIRIGIVGWGHSAKTFYRILSKNKNVDIVGIYVRSSQIEQGMLFFNNFNEFLNQNLDAIVIAIQPNYQFEYIIKAFENNLHVLCEKPIATKNSDIDDILLAWRKSNKIGMINFCYRLNEQFVSFRNMLKGNIIGDINFIKAEWILKNRLNLDLTTHWKCQKEFGGGMLNNFGSHLVDFLIQEGKDIKLLGKSQQTLYPNRLNESGVNGTCSGDEVSTLLMEVDKIPVTIHLSSISDINQGLKVVAYGTKGTIELQSTRKTSSGFPYAVNLIINNRCKEVDRGNCEDDATYLYQKVTDKFVVSIMNNINSQDISPSIEDGLKTFNIINN